MLEGDELRVARKALPDGRAPLAQLQPPPPPPPPPPAPDSPAGPASEPPSSPADAASGPRLVQTRLPTVRPPLVDNSSARDLYSGQLDTMVMDDFMKRAHDAHLVFEGAVEPAKGKDKELAKVPAHVITVYDKLTEEYNRVNKPRKLMTRKRMAELAPLLIQGLAKEVASLRDEARKAEARAERAEAEYAQMKKVAPCFVPVPRKAAPCPPTPPSPSTSSPLPLPSSPSPVLSLTPSPLPASPTPASPLFAPPPLPPSPSSSSSPRQLPPPLPPSPSSSSSPRPLADARWALAPETPGPLPPAPLLLPGSLPPAPKLPPGQQPRAGPSKAPVPLFPRPAAVAQPSPPSAPPVSRSAVRTAERQPEEVLILPSSAGLELAPPRPRPAAAASASTSAAAAAPDGTAAPDGADGDAAEDGDAADEDDGAGAAGPAFPHRNVLKLKKMESQYHAPRVLADVKTAAYIDGFGGEHVAMRQAGLNVLKREFEGKLHALYVQYAPVLHNVQYQQLVSGKEADLVGKGRALKYPDSVIHVALGPLVKSGVLTAKAVYNQMYYFAEQCGWLVDLVDDVHARLDKEVRESERLLFHIAGKMSETGITNVQHQAIRYMTRLVLSSAGFKASGCMPQET
eukprot:tig00021073_g18031.t1